MNPFDILGATPRDDRRRILELSEERALGAEADVCLQARADLINPRSRLVAELSWSPQIASSMDEQALSVVARANRMAARWDALGADQTSVGVAALLDETAEVMSLTSAAAALRDINADRVKSGFAIVASQQQIQEPLSARINEIGSTVNAALNRLPTSTLMDTMRAAAGVEDNAGTRCVLPFIDDMMDRHYEVGARAFLDAEAATVLTLIEAVKRRARFGEAALAPFLAKLEEVVHSWRRVALPILVRAKARGINFKAAADLGGSLRELSVHLNNEHHMYAAMQRLNTLLIECFAELPNLLARLQEDAAFLQKTASDYRAWAGRISLRAEIGVFRKDLLSICPSGVAWNDAHYPLKSISRIRFGGVRPSMYALLGSPSYVIAIGDATTETVFTLTDRSIYDAFIDKLWRAVGSRLTTDMFTALKAGAALPFADAVVHDECIDLPWRRLFGKREMISCAWSDIRTWNHNAHYYIGATAGKKAKVEIPYRHVHNVAILSAAISAARKRPGLRKLSELLDGS